MVSLLKIIDNLALIGTLVDKENLKKGAIVECGTWQGGMAAGLIELCGKYQAGYPLRCSQNISTQGAVELIGVAAFYLLPFRNGATKTLCRTITFSDLRCINCSPKIRMSNAI
jgi:hypothetical protein